MREDKLPEGWKQVPLLDVIDYEGGAQPPKKNFVYAPQPGYVRLLQIRDFGETPFPTYVPDSPRLKKAGVDDLLLARYGGSSANDTLGRICTGMDGAYNVALAKLVFSPSIVQPGFLKCFFQGPWFRQAVSRNSRSCQTGFNRGDLQDISLPLPPLAEQKRIVAKVEELLASVNAARDRLAHVPAILKRFRQSVLAAASSGALTSDWRNAHATLTAADLVETLRGNCQTEWLEPGFGDRPEPDLPQGWSFLALRNLGDWATGGTPSRSRRDFWDRGTVPWISPKDMKRPVLEDSQEHVTPKAISDTRLALLPGGTVLFVVRGMILAHTFPVTLTAVPATINQDVRSLIPSSGIEPRYLLLALQREAMWILFAVKEATHGTLRLESNTLHRWPIPVPPKPEQVEIVRRVEALFSLAAAIERRVAVASARADKLTQATLARAFRGELM